MIWQSMKSCHVHKVLDATHPTSCPGNDNTLQPKLGVKKEESNLEGKKGVN